MSTATEACFDIQTDATGHLAEAAFGPDYAAARAAVAEVAAPYGRLILRGAGQAEITAEDDLLPLADTLYAVLRALPTRPVVFLDLYSQPGGLKFERQGETIVVSDPEGDVRRYPAAELEAALVGVAARMSAMLRAVAPQDPGWAGKLARLGKPRAS